jgi:leucine dehydrogenase
MENLVRSWDGEYVVMRYDREAEAWMFVAIHSTVLGNAAGGTRLKVYTAPSDGLRDAQRLAAGMTFKWAAIDFPKGGGKGVIALSRAVDGQARDRLLERYGELVESLRGAFATGADLGVGPEQVKVIARETTHVFGVRGGGDPGPWTALGVYTAIEAVTEQLYGTPDLQGRTVLVQGLGNVGGALTKRLAEAGAKLKLADIDAERAAGIAGALGGVAVDAEHVYAEICDVFVPCAEGGVLNAYTIPQLRCKGIAGAANNQLANPDDAERLHKSGILYAPDFIANSGGAIALCGLEALAMSDDYVVRKILSIRDALQLIFREAADNDESPEAAAERRVRRILERGPA